ncbi:oxygenase MpaB family protein [Agreia bicolorata]|uniref:ER-bound oxygenase mpaB/mpaB'/Rubber oxygenase catalytic domain-containing protein n=1 Tax=Agreia bicolorata TaxID=110935 RepID=A0ABR5CCR9_9MICO|nr:oxygenase MpaB family protein [Agreia bicolorata]KJC63351.1 hypothetical protein TZ00_14730 [Agreia bicolorata]
MNLVPAALRDRIRLTLSGSSNEPPEWSVRLDEGDDGGFFAPGSATWGVHGGMSTIVAGIRALLIQALHPGAMAGVHDHSRYKEDPLGRLAGTIRWIFTVSYGDTRTAIGTSNWVLKMHERVVGSYVDARGVSRPYAANDPELLRWVHLAFTDSFLATAKLYGKPIPGGPDAYVREWAKAGELMGVRNPPRSEAELSAQLRQYLDAGELVYNDRVAEAVSFIRRPPLGRSLMPGYALLFAGAVASIPEPYRGMLRLRVPSLGPIRMPVAAVTRLTLRVIAGTLEKDPPSELAARRRLARLGIDAPAITRR